VAAVVKEATGEGLTVTGVFVVEEHPFTSVPDAVTV
jgi:hypothetical protein